jgi:hypothetical protein
MQQQQRNSKPSGFEQPIQFQLKLNKTKKNTIPKSLPTNPTHQPKLGSPSSSMQQPNHKKTETRKRFSICSSFHLHKRVA